MSEPSLAIVAGVFDEVPAVLSCIGTVVIIAASLQIARDARVKAPA